MLVNTLKKIINVSKIASDDPIRYTIQNVLVKKHDDKSVVIVATNGHMLTQAIVEDAELTNKLDTTSLLFSPENIKVAKLIYKDYVKRNEVPFEKQEKAWNLGDAHFSTKINVCGKGEFPSYETVIPKYDESKCTTIAFNAEYILALAEALKTSKRQNPTVKLIIKDKLSAIKVVVGSEESGFGVLMPCRT